MDLQDYGDKLRDPRWQRRRLEIFQRDDWTCQLCCRTDLELHVHHLYRTTENPWEEPDLHLLTVCKLCHEQQPANPRGSFKNPKRLYVTDDEWWKEHGPKYSEDLQEVLSMEQGFSGDIRECHRQLGNLRESVHLLRLDWEKSGVPAEITQPYRRKVNYDFERPSVEIQRDELWIALKSGGRSGLAEALERRRQAKE